MPRGILQVLLILRTERPGPWGWIEDNRLLNNQLTRLDSILLHKRIGQPATNVSVR
jgi:hypothetical protein